MPIIKLFPVEVIIVKLASKLVEARVNGKLEHRASIFKDESVEKNVFLYENSYFLGGRDVKRACPSFLKVFRSLPTGRSPKLSPLTSDHSVR